MSSCFFVHFRVSEETFRIIAVGLIISEEELQIGCILAEGI